MMNHSETDHGSPEAQSFPGGLALSGENVGDLASGDADGPTDGSTTQACAPTDADQFVFDLLVVHEQPGFEGVYLEYTYRV